MVAFIHIHLFPGFRKRKLLQLLYFSFFYFSVGMYVTDHVSLCRQPYHVIWNNCHMIAVNKWQRQQQQQKHNASLECFFPFYTLDWQLSLSIRAYVGLNWFETSTGMVRSSQIRHIHSLGSVFSSQLWQWMVLVSLQHQREYSVYDTNKKVL